LSFLFHGREDLKESNVKLINEETESYVLLEFRRRIDDRRNARMVNGAEVRDSERTQTEERRSKAEDVYGMKVKLEGAGIGFVSVTLAMLKAGSGELHKSTSVKQDSVEGIPHDVVDLGGLVLEGLGDLVPEDPAKLILMQLGELSIRW
jgi:hypothetical protein